MANTIKHRQSAVNGKVPTTAQIQLGELAVNTYDGKLYLKKNVLGTETVVDVSGSVTSLSIASANGFAGTVTTATTTPAITLSTSITGLLKGDGTSISAATAGTDYQVPISGGASTITASDLTASRALISNSSGKVAVSTATDTELGYLSGVTSAIQTQINGKAGTTTANTFTNNQIISVNSSSDALRITQTGAGNALVVEDSTPDSTPFVVDATGRLIVGSTTALTYSNSSPNVPNLQINALGSATAGISRFSPNSAGNSCWFLKSRGATAGAFDVVASGDTLGTIGFLGADGTDGIRAATISAQVDGTPGTNDMPGRLVFSTTADGASSPTERMRIDNQGRVGIGGTAGADTQLQLLGTYATSGAVTRVVRANGTIPSSTTGTARIYGTEITTQAASFTVSSLQHFYAAQAALGLGSAVTNQYGFLAEASLTGAANNFGFFSNIASGSGRYNFYAAGTADNYFGGPVQISASSTSNALQITQTGTGNALVVEDSTPDSTPFVVDATGRLIVGSTTALTYSNSLTIVPNLQLNALGSVTVGISRFAPNSAGNSCWFLKSRGATAGAFDVVASGDTLGTIGFLGADGTDGIPAATISAQVDGTPGTNDMPGRIIFSTTADGASSPTEKMRIDSAGSVGIGGTPSPWARIHVTGTYLSSGGVSIANYSTGAIPSTTTSSAAGFWSEPSTQAATFTLGSVRHFTAHNLSIGAGSTVTNQYGYFANSNLTGATNNYGFFSNIASGSGRYNFYAAGTARNYFAGTLNLGDPSDVGAAQFNNLSISGSGGVGYGIKQHNTALSSVTSTFIQNQSVLYTQAASFTLSTYVHFAVDQGAIGAGSTVTNQYGFLANSSLTGATNNYGFYSNIASGSGRYNFYAAGTADNYFEGNIKTNGTLAGGYSALSAGTTAMGLASDKVVKVTPNATATFTTTVAPAGATASIIIVTSGTTSYTITFGTGFLTTGTLATGTVTAKTFVVNFVSDGTTMIETSRTVAM